MNRSKKQRIIDILLDLKAIETASRRAKFDGLLMLQKVVFAAAEEYRRSQQRVLNQSFYRWDWGPMSEEVYEDFAQMKDLDLIFGERDGEVGLTKKGERILGTVSEVFKSNEELLSKLDRVASNVQDLDALLEEVYSSRVYVEELDKEMMISEIPEGVEMLSPIWESDAKEVFNLDNAWLETLDLLMDSQEDSKIRKSLDDARKGRILPLELD